MSKTDDPPALAKITRPQANNPVLRTRLFERLESLRESAVTWIAAAPGAGKTTLASSYLAECGLTHLWYQLNPDDADIASFFHYLGRAVQQASRRSHPPLPALTPEYLPGLMTFTRRYAETLADRIQPPCTIVLDNYEQVPAQAPLHEVIRELASSLPRGLNLLILSRTEPPAPFARLRLHGDLKLMSGAILSLTRDEAQALAAALGFATGIGADADRLDKLYAETQGWIAGFCLMLAEGAGSVLDIPELAGNAQQLLFDYFAAELFERFSAAEQQGLLKTALLPVMTSVQAEQISGDPAIGRILTDLHRQNCFVVRHGSLQPTYEYHALFRSFLLHLAGSAFPPEEWRVLQRQAAELLVCADQTEAAANLYRTAEDWSGLASLALREAQALIVSGRHQTLGQWIGSLPEADLAHAPWVNFWLGMARLPFDPAAARTCFEQAYWCFKEQDDPVGLYSSWAAIMDSLFFESREFTAVDRWVAEMEQLRERHPQFPSVDIEMRVYGSLGALVHRCPQHHFVAVWAERALALWDPAREPNLSMPLGCLLTGYFVWVGQPAKARGIFDRMEGSARSPQTSPLCFILFCAGAALYHGTRGEVDECLRAVQEGLAVAERTGLHVWDVLLHAHAISGTLVVGDVNRAEVSAAHMAKALQSHSYTDRAYYHHILANLSAQRGDWRLSAEQARMAVRTCIEVGIPFAEASCRIRLAQALLHQGEVAEATQHLDMARSTRTAISIPPLDYLVRITEAYAAFQQGEEALGLECLAQALALSREMDGAIMDLDSPVPRFLAPLYRRALEAGIEVEHVRSQIRRRRIIPDDPATAPENWPWPIRVYTLGCFEILCDDQPLRSSGKAQHKPLELFKCLCAFGGQAVNQDRITDTMWPEAQGDAAEQALRTTLHRLRKLLQQEQVIRLEDRHLSFDHRYIWIDSLAFDQIAHRPDPADRAVLLSALNRYRGHFLAGESAPWALVFRERLRAQYMRMTERVGTLLEQDGHWSGAAECYLGALEIEPVAEILYRRLMNSYAQSGRNAEALTVYQRCRQTLLTHLGVSPTQETQALYRTLLDPRRCSLGNAD